MTRKYRLLAALPAVGFLAGPLVANRVRPLVFGLPFLLAWIVGCVVLTSVLMAIVYHLDGARDDGA